MGGNEIASLSRLVIAGDYYSYYSSGKTKEIQLEELKTTKDALDKEKMDLTEKTEVIDKKINEIKENDVADALKTTETDYKKLQNDVAVSQQKVKNKGKIVDKNKTADTDKEIELAQVLENQKEKEIELETKQKVFKEIDKVVEELEKTVKT